MDKDLSRAREILRDKDIFRRVVATQYDSNKNKFQIECRFHKNDLVLLKEVENLVRDLEDTGFTEAFIKNESGICKIIFRKEGVL